MVELLARLTYGTVLDRLDAGQLRELKDHLERAHQRGVDTQCLAARLAELDGEQIAPDQLAAWLAAHTNGTRRAA